MSGGSDDVGQGKMRIKGTVCFCIHMHSSFNSVPLSRVPLSSLLLLLVTAGSEICVARLYLECCLCCCAGIETHVARLQQQCGLQGTHPLQQKLSCWQVEAIT